MYLKVSGGSLHFCWLTQLSLTIWVSTHIGLTA